MARRPQIRTREQWEALRDDIKDATEGHAETNPNSYQQITGIALGELMCPRHGGDTRTPIPPCMGVCYACAVAYGEPLRPDLERNR